MWKIMIATALIVYLVSRIKKKKNKKEIEEDNECGPFCEEDECETNKDK